MQRGEQAGTLSAEAFEATLRQCYDRLFGVCFRILGCAADAEDVIQEVCLSAPAYLHEFRGEASCASWLYRIAVNRSIDFLRARRRRGQAHVEWGEVEEMRQAESAEQIAARRQVAELMSVLSDEDRALLSLLMVEGMTQSEAAEALDLPPGTVGWRVSRIKKHMRAAAREQEVCHA